MRAISKSLLINRRGFVTGGAVAVCGCRASPGLAQSFNNFSKTGGCLLSEPEASILMSSDEPIVSYVSGNEPIIQKSGNAQFDRALATSLARMTSVFDVLPGFGFYNEEDGSGRNAYATTTARMGRSDGTILFGTNLFFELLESSGASDAAVLAVCAHEYAHIVQYKRSLHDRLNVGQSDVKRSELHADFLAGYFAGRRKLENANFAAATFATTMQSKGDYSDGPSHHGTPEERAAAVVRGFESAVSAQLSLDEAVDTGLEYVGA